MGSEMSFCESYANVWRGVKDTLKRRNEMVALEDKDSGIIKTRSASIQSHKLYEYALIVGVYKNIRWKRGEYHLEIKVSNGVSKTVVKVSAYIRGYGDLKGKVKTFEPVAFWNLKSNGTLEDAFLDDLRHTISSFD